MVEAGISSSRTAIYARISEDRGDGAGVSRQLADCRALSDRRAEWGQPIEFVDNDISAWRAGTRRPKYEAMLEGVRTGELGRIVVYHVDRLYRQPRELEELIDLADAGQVDVLSVVSGELDLRSPDGRFLARILVGVAAKESDDKSRRIRRQKRQRREDGAPSGGRRAFGWLDFMTPHREEAAVVRDAVDALLSGDSLIGVARRWNAAGIAQPQTGKARWTSSGVREVVTNPRNAGLVGYRPHKYNRDGRRQAQEPTVVGKARWPEIVPRERWELLQAVLRERGGPGRHPSRKSLLTGFVVCGACEARMVRAGGRDSDGGYTRHYWRCPARVPRDSCGRVSIDADSLETLVVESVHRAVDTQSLGAAWFDDEDKTESASLAAQLDALDLRRRGAAGSYAAGTLPLAALEQAVAAIEDEAEAVRRRLATMSSWNPMRLYAREPGLLRDRWQELGLDARRAFVSAVVEKVVISRARPGSPARFDPGRVEICWRA